MQANLSDQSRNFAPRLRLLWTVLANQEPEDAHRFLFTPHQYARAASDTERQRIEDSAITSMAPRLIVAAGPTPRLEIERSIEGKDGPIAAIDGCGHLRLKVGDEESRHQVETILKNDSVLARHAETLTGYLEQALALAQEDDEVDADSSLYRPSIAAHDRRQHHEHGV